MRNLARDTQPVYIARYIGKVMQQVNGKLTGKHIVSYSNPVVFYPSVTMARGQSQGDFFGVNLDYEKVLTIDDPTFAVSETDVLFVDVPAGKTFSELPYDYTIKKVARKGDFTVIAIKRVEVGKSEVKSTTNAR